MDRRRKALSPKALGARGGSPGPREALPEALLRGRGAARAPPPRAVPRRSEGLLVGGRGGGLGGSAPRPGDGERDLRRGRSLRISHRRELGSRRAFGLPFRLRHQAAAGRGGSRAGGGGLPPPPPSQKPPP